MRHCERVSNAVEVIPLDTTDQITIGNMIPIAEPPPLATPMRVRIRYVTQIAALIQFDPRYQAGLR